MSLVLEFAILFSLSQELHCRELTLCLLEPVFIETLRFHPLSFVLIDVHEKFLNIRAVIQDVKYFHFSVFNFSLKLSISLLLDELQHLSHFCWIVFVFLLFIESRWLRKGVATIIYLDFLGRIEATFFSDIASKRQDMSGNRLQSLLQHLFIKLFKLYSILIKAKPSIFQEFYRWDMIENLLLDRLVGLGQGPHLWVIWFHE